MSAELVKLEGISVRLVGGSGGVFEVRQDGAAIWSKVRGGSFPEEGEISALLGML